MSQPEVKDAEQPKNPPAPEAKPEAASAAQTAETKPGIAPPTDVTALLAAAKKEAADNYERYLRTAADLENFRRRTVREKDDLRQMAMGRVLEDTLPALDNLSLAVAAAKLPNAEIKSLTGGVEMVLAQLKSALANHGLKEINPLGLAFDPHQHEAISHVASAEVKEEHVVTVVRTGYTLNGKLLRPAAVVVSSGPAKADDAPKSS